MPLPTQRFALVETRTLVHEGEGVECSSCGQTSLVFVLLPGDQSLCPACYDGRYAARCRGCSAVISASHKVLKTGPESAWHEECLKCVKCETQMTGLICTSESSDHVYCKACFNAQPWGESRCSKCDKSFLRSDEKIELASPDGTRTSFHTLCFLCSDCEELVDIKKKFHLDDEKIFCDKCHSSKFLKTCPVCNKAVSEAVEREGKYYHKACFKCSEKSCSKKLGENDKIRFKTVKEKIYCIECYDFYFEKKCAQCEKQILLAGSEEVGMSFINYGRKTWHVECFKCQQPKCGGGVIDNRVFSLVDGKVTCQTCVKQFYVASVAAN